MHGNIGAIFIVLDPNRMEVKIPFQKSLICQLINTIRWLTCIAIQNLRILISESG